MFSNCCGCKRHSSIKINNIIATNDDDDDDVEDEQKKNNNITIKPSLDENSINNSNHDVNTTNLFDQNNRLIKSSSPSVDKQNKSTYDGKKKYHNNNNNNYDDDEFINGCRRIRLKSDSSLEYDHEEIVVVNDDNEKEIQPDKNIIPIITDDIFLELKVNDLEESCGVTALSLPLPPPTTIDNQNVIDNMNAIVNDDNQQQIDEIKSCLFRDGSSSKRLLTIDNPENNMENEQHDNEMNNNNNNDYNDNDDDDEVFSDSIPAKLPRGDMCTPYPKKQCRSSLQGLMILPDWFDDEREVGGKLEPPVTPIAIGRDELALKRHRLFTDLIEAAKAAVEHRVRFDPRGPEFNFSDDIDCDPNWKTSVTSDLEHLVDRLEKIVDRLERSVSSSLSSSAAKQLEFNTNNKQFIDNNSIDNLPIEGQLPSLNNKDKDKEEIKDDPTNIPSIGDYFLCAPDDLVVENLIKNNQPAITMSVNAFQDILNGPFSQYCSTSAKIGGDVAQHSNLVKRAFEAQLKYIECAAQYKEPSQAERTDLLKPTSDQIASIQEFREKHRTSTFFNHLSAVSESIPALGWVCVVPTPGPHVKEMNDAGQFYTNRVLKEWKEKDHTHVEWVRSWIQTLVELQQFIKQYHTTGLVWNGKVKYQSGGSGGGGGNIGKCAPPPPPPTMPPPPPAMPPPLSLDDLSLNASGDERSALFAEINKGQDITKGLKKVTSDMQTHKNATLRTGPAPFKTPATGATPSTVPSTTAATNKQPVFSRDGKKWIIEYQKSNPSLLVEHAEKNNVVYIFKCENSTVTVKGKINTIVMDSCKKCSILFDDIVSSVEFVNCQSVQMQVFGTVPTVVIDKTDGCQMYLSDQSMAVHIISSKSSEMNVLIPKGGGEYVEQPVPEQFVTTIKGKTLNTVCADSLG